MSMYPPGVTGNEPAITGLNVHCPDCEGCLTDHDRQMFTRELALHQQDATALYKALDQFCGDFEPARRDLGQGYKIVEGTLAVLDGIVDELKAAPGALPPECEAMEHTLCRAHRARGDPRTP